jgi:hypothetical protein
MNMEIDDTNTLKGKFVSLNSKLQDMENRQDVLIKSLCPIMKKTLPAGNALNAARLLTLKSMR